MDIKSALLYILATIGTLTTLAAMLLLFGFIWLCFTEEKEQPERNTEELEAIN